MNNQGKGCFWMLLLFPELATRFFGSADNFFTDMSDALFGTTVLDDSLLDDSEIFADEDFDFEQWHDQAGHDVEIDDFGGFLL